MINVEKQLMLIVLLNCSQCGKVRESAQGYNLNYFRGPVTCKDHK